MAGWGEPRGPSLQEQLADDLAAAVWRWKLKPTQNHRYAAEAALDAYMAARWGGVPRHLLNPEGSPHADQGPDGPPLPPAGPVHPPPR
jgi:hypothetical protein